MKPDDYAELRNLVRYDARRREFTASSCSGKHRFESFTQADRTIRRDLRKQARAYHCSDCHGYHVGGVANYRRKRLAREGKCA